MAIIVPKVSIWDTWVDITRMRWIFFVNPWYLYGFGLYITLAKTPNAGSEKTQFAKGQAFNTVDGSEILNNHLGCIKPNGIIYHINLSAGFLNHQPRQGRGWTHPKTHLWLCTATIATKCRAALLYRCRDHRSWGGPWLVGESRFGEGPQGFWISCRICCGVKTPIENTCV